MTETPVRPTTFDTTRVIPTTPVEGERGRRVLVTSAVSEGDMVGTIQPVGSRIATRSAAEVFRGEWWVTGENGDGYHVRGALINEALREGDYALVIEARSVAAATGRIGRALGNSSDALARLEFDERIPHDSSGGTLTDADTRWYAHQWVKATPPTQPETPLVVGDRVIVRAGATGPYSGGDIGGRRGVLRFVSDMHQGTDRQHTDVAFDGSPGTTIVRYMDLEREQPEPITERVIKAEPTGFDPRDGSFARLDPVYLDQVERFGFRIGQHVTRDGHDGEWVVIGLERDGYRGNLQVLVRPESEPTNRRMDWDRESRLHHVYQDITISPDAPDTPAITNPDDLPSDRYVSGPWRVTALGENRDISVHVGQEFGFARHHSGLRDQFVMSPVDRHGREHYGAGAIEYIGTPAQPEAAVTEVVTPARQVKAIPNFNPMDYNSGMSPVFVALGERHGFTVGQYVTFEGEERLIIGLERDSYTGPEDVLIADTTLPPRGTYFHNSRWVSKNNVTPVYEDTAPSPTIAADQVTSLVTEPVEDPRVAALAAERDRIQRDFDSYRAEVQRMAQALVEEAEQRDWCSEYEEFAENFPNLLRKREYQWDVTTRVYLETEVSASDLDSNLASVLRPDGDDPDVQNSVTIQHRVEITVRVAAANRDAAVALVDDNENEEVDGALNDLNIPFDSIERVDARSADRVDD